MKKLITSLVALTAFTAATQAQSLRGIKLTIDIVAPEANTALPCNDSFDFVYTVASDASNTDNILAGDTVWVFTANHRSGVGSRYVIQNNVAPGEVFISDTSKIVTNNMQRWVEVTPSGASIRFTANNPIPNGNIGLPLQTYITNLDIDTSVVTGGLYMPVSYNCATTGINDFTKTQLGIYPNPAKNQITLNFDATVAEGSVRVFDVMGRTILTQNVSKNTSAYTLDISSLNNGSYFVELVSGDVRGINKFVVSK